MNAGVFDKAVNPDKLSQDFPSKMINKPGKNCLKADAVQRVVFLFCHYIIGLPVLFTKIVDD